MSRVPTKGIDYTSKDYESFRNDMLKQLQIKMPEYTDLRQSDAGVVILELLAQGLDILSYYQDAIANESLLLTAEQRSNALKWCHVLGYIPRASSPAKFRQVFVLSSVQDTDIRIPAYTVVKTVGSAVEPSIYFETTEDLIIPAGKLGDEKDPDTNEYLYTVPIVQGVTVLGEILGNSNGSKGQTFKTSYTPVILDSVSVAVGSSITLAKPWNKVDTLVDSTQYSEDYTVVINDNEEAVITFGDGIFGSIPDLDSTIVCHYRIGGGVQGNVGARKICQLDTNLALIAETYNPYTADVEGLEKESLEDIKKNAPNVSRTKWGALTAEDFSDVIYAEFPKVDKVASYVNQVDPRNIDIYILLDRDEELTDSIKGDILEIFDENAGGRKIVGAGDINLYPAIKEPVDINIVLSVKGRYSFESVKSQVEALVTEYFAVGNRDFNTEFVPASLSAEIMNPENAIDGIRFIRITSPEEDSLVPDRGVIHVLRSLTITDGGA